MNGRVTHSVIVTGSPAAHATAGPRPSTSASYSIQARESVLLNTTTHPPHCLTVLRVVVHGQHCSCHPVPAQPGCHDAQAILISQFLDNLLLIF